MVELAEDVDALLDAFAIDVDIGGETIRAVWGDPYAEVPSGASSIASSDSSALVAAFDAAKIDVRAAIVRLDGASYRVAVKEPDETGTVVRLVLEKVTI